MEIERKFLVRDLPADIEQYEKCEIEQAYLCTSPTIRIRRMDDEYLLTVKENIRSSKSSAIQNREEEFRLSKETYLQLSQKCDQGKVSKTRYRINLRRQMQDGIYENLTAEVDIFHGRHRGLVLVEVEFPNIQKANDFTPPNWFGEEVSSDYHYRNSYLASMP